MKTDNEKLKGLIGAKADGDVISVYHNYLEAKAYHERNYNRCLENWRFYFGLDPDLGLGQWPNSVVQQMSQQHRQLLTYNFIKVAIDTLAGGIMQSPFDPDFIPVDSEINSLVVGVKKAMQSDKELMDWDVTFLEVVIHGLIYEAACKMVVSNKYNELGNIGLEICLPGSVITDPFWKTWASRDCKRCWKQSWLPVNELVKLYPEALQYVMTEKSFTKSYGDRYDFNTGVIPYTGADGRWGNAFEVIEQYDVVEECVKTERVITPEGDVEIPDMPDMDKPAWLNEFVPSWQPEHIYEKDDKRKVSIVRAICPSISHTRLLQSGKTEIQVEALPFHFWSASRHNGQSHSIVDSIKDVQKNINYWESMLTHKIQTEGGGGAQFVDPAGFKNNQEYLRYCNERNIPTKTFETKEGQLVDGKNPPAVPVNKSAFPSEVYENLNHMIHVILPAISKVTPSTLGRPDTGKDMSGRLYEMMRIQSDMQSYTIHKGLRLFYNGVYESYLIQAAQTYSNEMVPRRFTINKGRESVTLNEQVNLPDGSVGIKNDAAKLREMRIKVIISEKQDSPSDKRDKVLRFSDLLKNLPPEKILTRSIVWNKIVTNLDYLDDEDKEALEHADMMELELAEAQVQMQIAQARAVTQQTAMQQQAIEQQATEPEAPAEEELEEEPQAPQEAGI